MNDERKSEKPGFFDVVKSTLWGALGVQSHKNRERDFTHGNIKTFAVAGTIFTVLFIGTLIAIIKLVLRGTGM